MKQLEPLQQWYNGLESRERSLVIAATITIIITLFYLVIWEPIHQGLADQRQQYETQNNIHAWMQQAAQEVKTLKAGGSRAIKPSNQPVSIIIEQSASNAGLKNNLSKLDASGSTGARVKLDDVSFDQMLIWLNTLEQHHAIVVDSADIDRADKPGTVSARLSLNRS